MKAFFDYFQLAVLAVFLSMTLKSSNAYRSPVCFRQRIVRLLVAIIIQK